MASQAEGLVLTDVVKYEAPSRYSRRIMTLAISQTISLGEVLEMSSTSVVALATAASAVAIALEAVTTGAGATANILCLVRHGVTIRENLTYNSEDEDETDAALRAVGIEVRTNAVHDES